MQFLLMNGPNLNLLGTREPEVYGTDTLVDIESEIVAYGAEKGVVVHCFQSNHEGALIDALHEARGTYQGIIYNPGAHTHYSYALRDAVAAICVPTVEVHLSNIEEREDFRRVSVIAPVCAAQIMGKGKQGYLEAFDLLFESLADGAFADGAFASGSYVDGSLSDGSLVDGASHREARGS